MKLKVSHWRLWPMVLAFALGSRPTHPSLGLQTGSGERELVLFAQGRPRVMILEGSCPGPARELADFLGRMTGADFPVVPRGQTPIGSPPLGPSGAILIGLEGDFPGLGLEVPPVLGAEAFVLRSDQRNLYILGSSPRGVEHAVFTLLQELGCRWYFPGKVWEVVPKKDLIKGKWNEAQAPAFKDERRIAYGFGAYPDGARDLEDWNRHNRMGGDLKISIGHTWYGLDPKKDFEAHPDWFAQVGGRRKASKPCFSHPQVIEKAKAYALEHSAKGMVSMTPADGLGYCECERCLAVCQGGKPFVAHGTTFAKRPDGVLVNVTSETLFQMVNEVAKAVSAKNPQALLGCYAYSAYSHPPSFPLEPNVYVQTTTAYRRTDLTLEEQMQAFGKVAKHLGVREYYSVYQWDWDYPHNIGKIRPERLQKDLRLYHQNGGSGVNAEASNNWGPRGLGYYVAARLMWDVNADAPALVEDFYENAFGEAAPVMKRYYNRWYSSSATPPAPLGGNDETADGPATRCDPETLAACYRDLDEATRLLKNQPEQLSRVNHLRMYLHYLVLRARLDRAAKQKSEKEIVEAIREETIFGGRLASTHLIHARALLGKAFDRRFKSHLKLLEGIEEAKTAGKGWRKVGEPPSASELDQLWQEDGKILAAQPSGKKEGEEPGPKKE